jgi:NAD(P)-dependent dehydrogenase (short-subunit alcohol dehydrogenase family)
MTFSQGAKAVNGVPDWRRTKRGEGARAMEDVLQYAGKRVIVSGGASGMGEATARVLVELGAEVTVVDIKPTPVGGTRFAEVDLRDKTAIEQAAGSFGRVDALFNCAGLPGKPFSDVDVMLVNFVGARHLIECTVPGMPRGSAVAYIASGAGIGWQQQLETLMGLVTSDGFDAGKAWCEARPELFERSAYWVSKQVINAWTAWRSVALMRDHGIRLNCSNPGPTETPMMPAFQAISGKDLIDAAQGPIGRYSTPEEQAWPLVMLNSPRLSYVVGETLFVDGGFFGALQTGQVDFSVMMPK